MITTPEGEDSVSFISFHVVSSEGHVEFPSVRPGAHNVWFMSVTFFNKHTHIEGGCAFCPVGRDSTCTCHHIFFFYLSFMSLLLFLLFVELYVKTTFSDALVWQRKKACARVPVVSEWIGREAKIISEAIDDVCTFVCMCIIENVKWEEQEETKEKM